MMMHRSMHLFPPTRSNVSVLVERWSGNFCWDLLQLSLLSMSVSMVSLVMEGLFIPAFCSSDITSPTRTAIHLPRRPRVMTSVDIHCRSWNTWYIVRYYAASNESCMQYSTYLVLRDKAQVFCQLFKEFVFHPRFNRWVDLVILLWNGQWSHMCS